MAKKPDALERLASLKAKADERADDRENFALYLDDRMVFGGWSPADVKEYKDEVRRIMATGTDDERRAASEFWQEKADVLRSLSASGVADRVRAENAKNRVVAG